MSFERIAKIRVPTNGDEKELRVNIINLLAPTNHPHQLISYF